MEKVIECHHITHYYGSKRIYHNLSFDVERGKVLGLLGKNGTGKTTIINILNGYLRPTEGKCLLLGEDIRTISHATKARIGLLLEGHLQYSFFTIEQIERFYRPFYPQWKSAYFHELISKLKVEPKQKLHQMSCGQRSQVALGLLFAQDPDLLILDDFSMGLDPGYRRLFIEYVKEWADHGNKTIFLTSHIIQDMEHLINDCIILDYGKILLHKPTEEILKSFHRHTFTLPEQVQLKEEPALHHPESRHGAWELYSFLTKEEVQQLLQQQGIHGATDWQVSPLSLEDAFVGLTGKY